jgi:hypothetical protein
MRLSYLIVCTLLVAGCASHTANMPVASVGPAATPLNPDKHIELRHMYLFAPGKSPVLVIGTDGAPSMPQEVSSQPRARD